MATSAPHQRPQTCQIGCHVGQATAIVTFATESVCEKVVYLHEVNLPEVSLGLPADDALNDVQIMLSIDFCIVWAKEFGWIFT